MLPRFRLSLQDLFVLILFVALVIEISPTLATLFGKVVGYFQQPR